jgi:ABC-type uncharacterized transport system substrate-binding protein
MSLMSNSLIEAPRKSRKAAAGQRPKDATNTIPVVTAIGDDPVEIGLVARLDHPSGNVMGMTTFATELNGNIKQELKN